MESTKKPKSGWSDHLSPKSGDYHQSGDETGMEMGFMKFLLHFYYFYDLNYSWLVNVEVYVCMSVCHVFAYFDILFQIFSSV